MPFNDKSCPTAYSGVPLSVSQLFSRAVLIRSDSLNSMSCRLSIYVSQCTQQRFALLSAAICAIGRSLSIITCSSLSISKAISRASHKEESVFIAFNTCAASLPEIFPSRKDASNSSDMFLLLFAIMRNVFYRGFGKCKHCTPLNVIQV